MKVKICGIKNLTGISIVNCSLPDYAGFVLAESKRQVSLEQASFLRRQLDRRISGVAVCVNPASTQVRKIAEAGFNVIQLHGDESVARLTALRRTLDNHGFPHVTLWKAISIKSRDDIKKIMEFPPGTLLLDGYHPSVRGGTGIAFDWKLVDEIPTRHRFILAGGLSPDNIREKLAVCQPWGVDVSSGVEVDGEKNPELVAQFIEAVRSINDSQGVAI